MSELSVACAVQSGPEVSVVPIGPAARRIELRGELPVGWAGHLVSGLAAQRINIVRGWAREQCGVWEGQLQVELPQYTMDLTPAAVLQLARPEPRMLRSALDGLELLAHWLVPSGDEVVVEIEAADARGFLDRLLRVFSAHGLFPREMSIETSDGMVHDVFRLRALYDGAPAPAAVAGLLAKLRRVTI